MATLFSQYLVTYNYENFPNSKKIAQDLTFAKVPKFRQICSHYSLDTLSMPIWNMKSPAYLPGLTENFRPGFFTHLVKMPPAELGDRQRLA